MYKPFFRKIVLSNFRILLFLLTLLATEISASQRRMSMYLLVYFKEETHSLYFALSKDGYSFIDINDGNPILRGDTLALQKGVRDPHLFRGPDGAFYLSMTDLHINPVKHGYRDTRWERDPNIYGWGNNRSLVLMKSKDLIHWSHTIIRFDKISSEYKDLGCVWAPQTIYDNTEKKLMLYFTMRMKNERERIYYCYVNDEYDELLTIPIRLFDYPKSSYAVIDADITKIGDKFRMFYVSHEGAGIKQAISDRINEGYVYDDSWYDSEEKGCEAPNVWQRIGKKEWVLMYDIYGIKPNNFAFRETLDFVTFRDLGRFNEGVMKSVNFSEPKHGSVIQITKDEAKSLIKYWQRSKIKGSKKQR